MDRRTFIRSLLALPAALVAAPSAVAAALSRLDLRSYWGVDGPPTGNHADMVVCDDVETGLSQVSQDLLQQQAQEAWRDWLKSKCSRPA